jgi:uncharacterized protein (TIGR02466 family)
MKKHEVFTVPIWEFDLRKPTYNNLTVNNEELKTFVERYKKLPDRSITRSNVGGFQSVDLPLDILEVQHLVNIIEQTINDDKTFNSQYDQIVFNMWFNINRYKDSNIPHSHPFSLYAGVYYVKAPENCGHILFEAPNLDLLRYYNRGFEGLYRLPPVENTLYIFPGWLKHYVEPSQNEEEERISISFNTSNGV